MLWNASHREYFWLLVRRDLKVRYAGSTLGALWNLIHPLILIAIYMIIFSTLMRGKWGATEGTIDYGALTYAVHLCAGLIPWLLFSDVLNRSVGVLLENRDFLRKVALPPGLLFAALAFNACLVHGAGFLVFTGILMLAGHAVPVAALAGLVVMALLAAVGVGLGFVLAGLNVFFRDVGQVVTVLMQLLFWFNPIVYYKSMFFGPGAAGTEGTARLADLARILMWLNPFERFITMAQRLFGVVALPATSLDWAIVALFPPLCLGMGWWVFVRMLPDVRDAL